jgi:hypothetical protein
MPKGKATCVVRSKDGRFFEIPEALLKKYQVAPDELSADERRDAGSPTRSPAQTLRLAKGLVQITINVPAGAQVHEGGTRESDVEGQGLPYEAPAVGDATQWGDDPGPIGGTTRRG